jgi:hypothetical protein
VDRLGAGRHWVNGSVGGVPAGRWPHRWNRVDVLGLLPLAREPVHRCRWDGLYLHCKLDVGIASGT